MHQTNYADIIALMIPIIAIFSGALIAASAIITKYKLKVEQIKADAMVRAEEIKAKNKLDLEKLFVEDNAHAKSKPNLNNEDSYDSTDVERNSRRFERY